MHHLKIQGAIALALAVIAPIQAQNLVFNGSFETNGGLGQLAPSVSSVSGWASTGTPTDSAPYAFNFVVNANADSVGFPSIYTPPQPNVKIWGPANGVYNGFVGSSDGGFFMGLDGGYATAALSQTISGLSVGQSYNLSFEWAASQFTDMAGATTQNLTVTFGTSNWTTPSVQLDSQGFSGWMPATHTFTADSETQTLSFLAYGFPGLPPFVLLDGVSLTASPVPEPESYAMVAGLGLAAIGMARWRSARRAQAS